MGSAFAFEDADFTLRLDRGAASPEYVYAVRLRDAGALTYPGNMGWIDAMNDYRSFDGVEGWARHYWR